LALLAAGAVTLGVSVACVTTYELVRTSLVDSIDSSLRGPPALATASGERKPPVSTTTPRVLQLDAQRLSSDGAVLTSFGAADLPVTQTDRAIARNGGQHYYDTYDSDGTHVRVLIRHVSTGGATMVGRPLTETDHTLSRLRLLFLLLVGAGVLGSGGLGLLVARAGIAPVDRLTAAAERIARTEIPDPPIPVEGGDELARLGRAINKMVTALAGSRDRQRNLILDAGHELRTPVTVLQANLELLHRAEQYPDRLPTAQRQALLADLEAQARELSELVGEVIELARGDENVERLPVDLREPLSRAVERVRLRAAPTVTFDIQTEETTVTGDTGVLERAFVNLLDNAIKFGPARQTVRVRLRRRVLQVEDEGPGVADRDLPHVFDRFYRATDSRQLPGSGLGLAIVARAAELHAATVRIEPSAHRGALVIIDFSGSEQPGHDD
jgi:two-component system sensor histidine kinase MprB